MHAPGNHPINLPLENLYPTADGYIARQTTGNNPENELLTFRWYHSGNARLTIPLRTIALQDPATTPLQQEFQRHGQAAGITTARIIDCTQLTLLIAGLQDKYRRLRQTLGLETPYYAKIVLHDIKNHIPYINLPSYLDTITTRGIPVIQDNTILCPPGTTPAALTTITDSIITDPLSKTVNEALPLVYHALRAMGIMLTLFDPEISGPQQGNTAAIEEFAHAILETPTNTPTY